MDLKKKFNKFSIAPIIVVDFCWALLNSLISEYNKISIIKYLDLCFDIIVNENRNQNFKIFVRPYICATHFLKTIINKAKSKAHTKFKNARLQM